MTEISVSRIRTYKECLRAYELRYKEQLEAVVPAPALVTGKSYHRKIEELIERGEFEDTGSKTDAMAHAFEKFIYPHFEFVNAEEKFEIPLDSDTKLIGYIDAKLKDGTPVEHKTSSSKPDDAYREKLAWDDQVAMYMLATGRNRMLYTVCQKPTIRQRKTETEAEYIKRCGEWYGPDKIKAFYVYRSREELKDKLEEFKAIANEMKERKFFYRNPSHCRFLNCPFESICLDYEPGTEDVPLGFRERESDR